MNPASEENPMNAGSLETSTNQDLSSITVLLRNVTTGQQANEALYLAVKTQLKEIAERQMTAADHMSLEASHVVNHVYMELVGNAEISWQDREHFLSYACKAIRSFLVDRARHRRREKRGGGQPLADLDAIAPPVADSPSPDEQKFALSRPNRRVKSSRHIPCAVHHCVLPQ